MSPSLPRSLTLLLRLTTVALVLGLGSIAAQAKGASYTIDKGHSALLFRISHLGVSYTHGRFNDFSGSFHIDDQDPTKSSIELDISAESVDSNDEGRDKHLRQKDYFNVEEYPSIGFKSTSIKKLDGKVYRVTGKFTLLAVTKEITFRMEKIGEADDPWGNHRMGFEGLLVIKRSDYGMTTMIPNIGDEVRLTLGIEGILNKPKADKKDAKEGK